MRNKQYIGLAIVTLTASIYISACNNSTQTKEVSSTTSTPTATTAAPASTHPMSHGAEAKININKALTSELDKIEDKLSVPGLAEKIQAQRPYAATQELVSKKVIDQQQFDKVKDLLTIEEIALTGVEKDVDYMVKLGLMKGHLFVAKELLALNKPKDAEPHIGHPVEEIYADVADQLNERKIKEFKTTLATLQSLVKAGAKDSTKVDASFKESMRSVDSAIAALPVAQRQSPTFVLQVINGLLNTASSEYGAAIADGKIKAAIEYQDSRGFVTYANLLYQGIAASMSKDRPQEHKVISESFKQLLTVWPTVVPPANSVKTPIEVSKSISAIQQSTQKVAIEPQK
jgi:Helix-hairpin-helix motif